MTRVRVLLLLVASAWLAGCGQADGVDVTNTQQGVLPATEGSKDFGDYVVFFNALNTDQLKPEIAREYEIVRSKSRAMLSVAIHKKGENGQTSAVTGAVTASAVNFARVGLDSAATPGNLPSNSRRQTISVASPASVSVMVAW